MIENIEEEEKEESDIVRRDFHLTLSTGVNNTIPLRILIGQSRQ
jgi:hypothetical protein